MKRNVVREKSYRFALRIVRLADALRRRGQFELARQLLKAGTSIGANVEEAQAGMSRADFLAKLSVASKEAREARFWLRLLRDSNALEAAESTPAIEEVEELVALLTAILKTGRSRR